MSKKQPVFHPLSMIPTILEISQGSLDASGEHLSNMKLAKEEPYLLDDNIINRSLKLCKEQREDSALFLQQCAIWQREQLTELQLKQVQQIADNTHLLNNVNDQLLAILDYCKDLTINKILEKDDMQLALEVLTGKMPFPK